MTYMIIISFAMAAFLGYQAHINNQTENYNALFYAGLALACTASGVVGLIVKWVM